MESKNHIRNGQTKDDSDFEKMEKKFRPSQEEFYIHSHSHIV